MPYTKSPRPYKKEYKKQKEREFTIVNPTFQGTIFEKICFDLKAHRGRLMKLMSKTAYSIHRDRAPRVHIAIDTNPDSMFLFPDQENKQIYHILQCIYSMFYILFYT